MNSFTVPVLAVLALWLKMDAEETGVLRLDRNAEQLAATNPMVRHSVIAFERWVSPRSLLHLDRRGRTLTPSV